MGNAASMRRASRTSDGDPAPHEPPEQSGAQRVESEEPEGHEGHEENDAFDALFAPTSSTRRPLRSLRRHSVPVGAGGNADADDADDADTICDTASIMTAFTDATLTSDPLQAYAAGSTTVSAAVAAAMAELNSAKGWRRDAALAQLEWLAADGARRARWVRAEAGTRHRRARRRASLGAMGHLGPKAKKADLRLSTAGEERVAAEDAATSRRVLMERAAGDQRAGAEDDAKRQLERAHDAVRERTHDPRIRRPSEGGEGGEGDDTESAHVYATRRGQLRAAEEKYHAACAQAATEHAEQLALAARTHERAFSTCTVNYMGQRLRDPDAQGDVTFTAAAGTAIESKRRRSVWSGQYQVGQWQR
ncbi:hypothetical protein CspeluHIS016_0900310 [Cutaneotrichosporon spelunceum]|uniref:Uncharacterized protein n=1 Tax=Cutaneotrichosporon spelunceum TaxID=1672016 RepID=A0AAD3YF79_9TREE|nr:hypothetical protein CspeluHIS016_0900310 [Cutaneotrichosporon spelunceum]